MLKYNPELPYSIPQLYKLTSANRAAAGCGGIAQDIASSRDCRPEPPAGSRRQAICHMRQSTGRLHGRTC